ncbi:metal ABC transporter solute-binding protein, Zn/Mn family [Desulfothermobacter acidiphilus]|uniref:metal ABC transporter solute-binding protein, Zn/Mn family n=1 Tax=Desulfothermobacter acidiphilus TaxID=1938353 RepID=UPI003F8B8C94
MFNLWLRYLLVLLGTCLLAVTGCAQKGSGPEASSGKLKVTTTTTMISDLVQQVGGDRVEVTGIMRPGVDPHLYKATQSDMLNLKAADLVFYNGLNLEGKMGDIFVRLSRQKPTFAISEYIAEDQLREPQEFAGHYDPHIWFDVSLWKKAAERVRDGLSEVDPNHADYYRQRAKNYLKQLDELDAYIRQRLAAIPPEQRVLITAHDAFGYLGRAYGIEVRGLQGISTDTEYGLKDVQQLVDFIVQHWIKAVFVESSVPHRSIQAVVEGARKRGHEVKIGGELYSDALGDPGTPAGSYIGMFKHNVDTIVEALK